MADQIEAPKVTAYILTGSDSDEAASSKVVAYFVIVPGEGGQDESTSQGHVHTQILRRS